MMCVKTKVLPSKIHGLGLFADQNIPKGTMIWKFTPGFDLKFTKEQILNFPKDLQIYLAFYSWKSKKSGMYCFSSDNGKYFNHSDKPNVLSAYKDGEEEVITTSLKEIKAGEEILDNYSSFEETIDNDNVLEFIAKKYKLEDEILDPCFKKKQENH